MSSPILSTREWWDDHDFPERLHNQYFADLLDEDDVRKLISKPKFRSRLPFSDGVSEVSYTEKSFQITFSTGPFKLNEIKISVNDDFIVVSAKHDVKDDENESVHTISRELIRKYPLPHNCQSNHIDAYYFRDKVVITVPLNITPSNFDVSIRNLDDTEDIAVTTNLSSLDGILLKTLDKMQAGAVEILGAEDKEHSLLHKTSRSVIQKTKLIGQPKGHPKVLEAEIEEVLEDITNKAENSVAEAGGSESEKSLVSSSETNETTNHEIEPTKENESIFETSEASDSSKTVEVVENNSIDLKIESKPNLISENEEADIVANESSEEKESLNTVEDHSKETASLESVDETEKDQSNGISSLKESEETDKQPSEENNLKAVEAEKELFKENDNLKAIEEKIANSKEIIESRIISGESSDSSEYDPTISTSSHAKTNGSVNGVANVNSGLVRKTILNGKNEDKVQEKSKSITLEKRESKADMEAKPNTRFRKPVPPKTPKGRK